MRKLEAGVNITELKMYATLPLILQTNIKCQIQNYYRLINGKSLNIKEIDNAEIYALFEEEMPKSTVDELRLILLEMIKMKREM